MSQRRSQLSDLQESKLKVKMVKYLLNNSISKLGIKRTDLIAVAGCNNASFTPIFENAKEALREVYGFNVIEVPKGGSVSEEAIFKFLKRMGINIDEPHDYFGDDIKELLTATMPNQFYLLREKEIMEGTTEENIKFSWGFRSTLEYPKAEVLDAVAEMLLKPSYSFVKQYDEAHPEDIEMDVV